MSKLQDIILTNIQNDTIPFEALNHTKSSISVKNFESQFDLIAAVELHNIEQYTFYYRSHSNSNIIMCVKLAKSKLTANLGIYKDFEKRFAVMN